MDHTAAAMLNVIEYSIGEIIKGKGKTYIIIEYGAQKSSFMIYKNSVMVFHKDINIGGLTITEEIQRQMGVNYEEAESLKIQGDGSGNIPEEVVEIINQVLETFFAELKKTIDFWVSSTSEETFDGLILTGGGSLIPGFAESMQELIETEVQIFDPFPAVLVNESRISEDMLPNISAMGVVAIGLAMRSLAK
jgi:type IV pilus assembly protein PilM